METIILILMSWAVFLRYLRSSEKKMSEKFWPEYGFIVFVIFFAERGGTGPMFLANSQETGD